MNVYTLPRVPEGKVPAVTAHPLAPAGPARAGVPAGLKLVLAALALEALALLAVAGLLLWTLREGEAADTGLDLATTAFCLLLACLLVVLGRALWAGRRWARSPVLTLQLLTLFALAAPALRSEAWWIGAALAVVSLIAGAGLFLPPVMTHTRGREAPPLL